ncbi:MAG: hypothetical protein Q9224_002576 [Gallowayella concinna]
MKRRTFQLSSSLSTPAILCRTPTSRYICLQCRHRVRQQCPAPRVKSTTTPSLHRTYATEPSIPNRLQQFVAERIAPKMWKDGIVPQRNPKVPATEEEVIQHPVKSTQPTKDDVDYTLATSGEGLETIGGPTGWWEKGWDKEHQFQGFLRPTPMQNRQEIRKAIERALVEWYTVEKGDIEFREGVGAAHRLWANDRSWELVPVGNFALWQTEKGKVKLEWERPEGKMEMYDWLQQPFLDAQEITDEEANALLDSEELGASPDISAQDVNDSGMPERDPTEAMPAESEDSTNPPSDGDGAGPAKPATQRHSKVKKASMQYSGLQGNISLHNHNLKFTVIKRVMQLTGIRISDTAIQSIDSSLTLFRHLIQKPKPKKLAQLLVENRGRAGKAKAYKGVPQLANLPNVQILPTKYVPSMAETALGRQKVIEKELDQHGIPVPFREEIERITAYEEQRLRRQIDAMVEDDASGERDMWSEEPLPDEAGEVQAERDVWSEEPLPDEAGKAQEVYR